MLLRLKTFFDISNGDLDLAKSAKKILLNQYGLQLVLVVYESSTVESFMCP